MQNIYHPYTNIPSSIVSILETIPKEANIENKTDLLKRCKYIIGSYIIESDAIECYIQKHRLAWDVIYPCKKQPYVEPEEFIKELNFLQQKINAMQYRYTMIEMFM